MTKLKVYTGMSHMPGRNAHAVGQYHSLGQVTIYVSAETKNAAYTHLKEGGFNLATQSGFKLATTGTAAKALIAGGVFAEPTVVVTHRMNVGPVLAFTDGLGARVIGELVSLDHVWTFNPDIDPDRLFLATFALNATQLANRDFPLQWLALAAKLAEAGKTLTGQDAAAWANLGYTPAEAKNKMDRGITLKLADHAASPQRAHSWHNGVRIA